MVLFFERLNVLHVFNKEKLSAKEGKTKKILKLKLFALFLNRYSRNTIEKPVFFFRNFF